MVEMGTKHISRHSIELVEMGAQREEEKVEALMEVIWVAETGRKHISRHSTVLGVTAVVWVAVTGTRHISRHNIV